MKNYREMKRYCPDEWEDSDEWKGSRLDFLWEVRLYYPQTYLELKLSEEKEDFYVINDEAVARIASSKHYSVDMEMYKQKYEGTEESELTKKLNYLKNMRVNNPQEFLLKKNCNLFEYLRDRLQY